MSDGHRIEDRNDALRYVEGGHAIFTVVSGRTGARFTYEVKRGKAGSRWEDCLFVGVLTQSDNEGDYAPLGLLNAQGQFHAVKRSKIGREAPSFKVFEWLVRHALKNDERFAACEFWHHGACSMCGLRLTAPESIARGLGPTCAKKAAA